ncbi:hypothetical protein [Salinarimonas sp.]|uniref:hypothetical protein n=1 Tax=Salinarimonas sp. TaxID=2766526 RepID=UPI003918E6B7
MRRAMWRASSKDLTMKTNALRLASAIALGLSAFALPMTEASALDRRVEIVNRTGYTMVEFYASNQDRTTWEEDILGASVLPSGRSVVIDIDDASGYCMFDFKAVFDDGDEVEEFGVNVCEVATFTFE